MDEIHKKNELDGTAESSIDSNSSMDDLIDDTLISEYQDDEPEVKNIIEIDDAELDDDLQDLILDPLSEDENEENGDGPAQTDSTFSEAAGSDEDDGFVEYVHRDHSNTLSRSAIIYALTDLTLTRKKSKARSMIISNPDKSITLESDKSLSRDDVEDLIAKLTS